MRVFLAICALCLMVLAGCGSSDCPCTEKVDKPACKCKDCKCCKACKDTSKKCECKKCNCCPHCKPAKKAGADAVVQDDGPVAHCGHRKLFNGRLRHLLPHLRHGCC